MAIDLEALALKDLPEMGQVFRIVELGIEVVQGQKIDGLPRHAPMGAIGNEDTTELCGSTTGSAIQGMSLNRKPIGLVKCDSCFHSYV